MTATLRDRLAAAFFYDATGFTITQANDESAAADRAGELADLALSVVNVWEAEMSEAGDTPWDRAVERLHAKQETVTENTIDEVITSFVKQHAATDIITGWITLVAVTKIEDGEESSGLELIFSGGKLPWDKTLGLIEGARIRLHNQWGRDA